MNTPMSILRGLLGLMTIAGLIVAFVNAKIKNRAGRFPTLEKVIMLGNLLTTNQKTKNRVAVEYSVFKGKEYTWIQFSQSTLIMLANYPMPGGLYLFLVNQTTGERLKVLLPETWK